MAAVHILGDVAVAEAVGAVLDDIPVAEDVGAVFDAV